MKIKSFIGRIINESYIRFIVVSTILGVVFSFFVIPAQSPDESTHIKMIGEEICNENYSKALNYEYDFGKDRIMKHEEQKLSPSEIKKAMLTPARYNTVDCLIKGFSIQAIRHLPAIVGSQLGILLHLPIYWVLQLGELFGLALYIFVGYWILKTTKYKNWVFELVLVLPMCLHQAASFNYDVVLLSTCFYLVAYIINLREKEEIKLNNILVVLGLLLVISIIKLPYIVLGLMIFIVPFDRIKIRILKFNFEIKHSKKAKIVLLAFLLVISGIAFIVFKDNLYIRVLTVCIKNFGQFLYLIKETYVTYSNYLFESLMGKFGWLDVALPELITYGGFAMLIVFAMTSVYKEEKNNDSLRLNLFQRSIIMLSAIILTLLIFASMINHTALITYYGTEFTDKVVDFNEAIYHIPFIGGVQGRYYIPAVLAFLLALPETFEINQKKYNYLFWIISAISIYACATTLLFRFIW